MEVYYIKTHKHIGAYGVIIEEEKIILINKSRGPYTGLLDLPGGGFEHGETPIECLTREIKEETNLDVEKVKILNAYSKQLEFKYKNDIEQIYHIGILYITKCNGVPSEDGDGIDSLGAKWYEIKNLKKENITPFTKMGLEELGYIVK